MSARRARDEVDARRADTRRTRGSARVTPGTRVAASVAVAIAMASRLVDNDTVEHVGTGDVSKSSQRVRSYFGKSESPCVRIGPSPPGHSSARARGGEPPAALYNVLGKSKGGQTEEQSLARLNDQCNRLMRQIEGSIEQAEVARSKRFALGDDDPVMGIPKPGEDLWSEAYADHERMVAATLLRSPGDAVRDAPSTSRARGDSDAPARHPVSPSRALESTSTSRAHARDPPRPVEDKALADEAFRQGQAALDAGQARAALAHFRRAHEACPKSRTGAIAKVERLIAVAQERLAVEVGGAVAAADGAYRAALDALAAVPPDRRAALEHLRRAEAACPPGRPAAVSKIRKLIEGVEKAEG